MVKFLVIPKLYDNSRHVHRTTETNCMLTLKEVARI